MCSIDLWIVFPLISSPQLTVNKVKIWEENFQIHFFVYKDINLKGKKVP